MINDANAALLAEFIVGSAKGMQNAVMITIGTGIGGAIAINGKSLVGQMAQPVNLGISLFNETESNARAEDVDALKNMLPLLHCIST